MVEVVSFVKENTPAVIHKVVFVVVVAADDLSRKVARKIPHNAITKTTIGNFAVDLSFIFVMYIK